jgi:2-polyprenyl-3-methyl-5-hydroxy-6-metoxy-1,4-benzoquinol methylase
MNAQPWVKRVANGVRHRFRAAEVRAPQFDTADIDLLVDLHARTWAVEGSAWDPYRHAHLRLPDWFKHDLDPWSDLYREQQLRLWQLVTGVDRPYDPELDEKEESAWSDVDPVRRPGYFQRRDPAAVAIASDHQLATGMLLKHSGLKPGDRALEYGAGFGQTALAFARLGVEVDTVDVSETFCRFVREQATFFQVSLAAHRGQFGINPRPGERYRLIWFYESFHHCLDFRSVVPQLVDMLEPGGRIVLGGEPIVAEPCVAVPYSWGLRLHSEAVVMTRKMRWCELGFTESFLFDLFARSGLGGQRVECEPSPFGRLFVFTKPS